MAIMPPMLVGKRVLIVEDELLVALLIEDLLVDLGCTPVGPYGSVATALEAARTAELDLAILDVNLDGELVYPVADTLILRHVPFLFLSGYGNEAIPPGHPEWRVCAKPFKSADLERMLTAALVTELH